MFWLSLIKNCLTFRAIQQKTSYPGWQSSLEFKQKEARNQQNRICVEQISVNG